MPNHDLEHSLPDLMQQAAETIPPTADISAAVQQRIGGALPGGRPLARTLPRSLVATLGAGLVVALIAALLIHGRATRQTRLPSTMNTSPTTSNIHCAGQPASVHAIACPVTDKGITVQVISAYADAYRTSVRFTIGGAALSVNDPSVEDATLTDSQGHILSWNNGGNYSGKDPHHIVGEMDFAPLSTAQLAQPESLMLVIKTITPMNLSLPPAQPNITGTWQSTFTVTPVPGTFYHVQMAPVVQQGVGMQVQSLEVAPAAPANLVTAVPIATNLPRGVRIILRITGLPSGTLLQSVLGWSDTSEIRCNGMSGCPLPTVGILTLPGWTLATPSNLLALPLTTPLSQTTVSSSGTVLLELLYPGQGSVQGNTATLSISNFQLKTGNPTAPTSTTLPPWHLTLPLSAQG